MQLKKKIKHNIILNVQTISLAHLYI